MQSGITTPTENDKLKFQIDFRHLLKRLTTGKIEKVDSHHVPAIKFIGKKQLV